MSYYELDENGWPVNNVGCTHDGAPCPWCLSNPGVPRPQMFFPVDPADEDDYPEALL